MKILAGTNNPAKINYWKTILPDYEIISLKELGINIDIKEGMNSVKENSEKKALTYAEASSMLTVSDDRGLRIPALDNEPGIAVRTWGGRVPRMDDEEWMSFFKRKIRTVSDTTAFFDSAITVARPDGKKITIMKKDKGHFDMELVERTAITGFPLSRIFIREDSNKTWAQMTDKEKQAYQSKIAEKVVGVIEELTGE